MNSLYVRFGINPIHKIVTLTTGEYAYKEGINRLENMLIKKESIVRLSTSFSNWEKLYIRVTYIRALESAATITAQARIYPFVSREEEDCCFYNSTRILLFWEALLQTTGSISSSILGKRSSCYFIEKGILHLKAIIIGCESDETQPLAWRWSPDLKMF
jgi:hypothetical protein